MRRWRRAAGVVPAKAADVGGRAVQTPNLATTNTHPSRHPNAWGSAASAASAASQSGEASARVLVVDSDPRVRESVTGTLEGDGCRVTGAGSGEEGLRLFELRPFDLLVLDTALSGMSGLDLLRRIREHHDVLSIIVSTERGVADRIAGLDCGADDYLVKPVAAAELSARVRAILRRRDWGRPPISHLTGPRGVEMSLRSHEVRVDDSLVALTPHEFSLLQALLERPGQVLSPDDLSWLVWGYGTFGDRNFVQACISRLRAKLNALGATAVITTVRGVGYIVSSAARSTSA